MHAASDSRRLFHGTARRIARPARGFPQRTEIWSRKAERSSGGPEARGAAFGKVETMVFTGCVVRAGGVAAKGKLRGAVGTVSTAAGAATGVVAFGVVTGAVSAATWC